MERNPVPITLNWVKGNLVQGKKSTVWTTKYVFITEFIRRRWGDGKD